MLRIGLTGGIGSGKSTVARIFEVLGIPVYYADDAAKRLMTGNAFVKEQIINAFGVESYIDDKVNRKHISSIVFNKPEELSKLNAIVHPATIKDAAEWMVKQTTSYIIKEAALIFESGAQKNLDYVIGVSSPQSLRVLRIMQRDHLAEEEILSRMNSQMDEEIKMRLCDFIIINDEKELIMPQVLKIHQQLLALKSTD